ncbi:hypothetical protein Tco_0648358 [Tanacetum coccineum]
MGREKGPEEKDFILGYPKIKGGGKDDFMAEGKRERTHAWTFCLSEVPESMKGNLKLRLRSKGSPREVMKMVPLLPLTPLNSELSSRIDQTQSHRSHGVKLEGSMNYAKGKSWALLLSIYKWSRQRAPLEQT